MPDPAPPGGFEDHGSSAVRIDDGADGVTVQGLTISDSRGTSPEGDDPLGDCVANTFAGNSVTGRTAGSGLDRSIGMILSSPATATARPARTSPAGGPAAVRTG